MKKQPSECKQRLNTHNEGGFVCTDQTQSHAEIHSVPDKNPMDFGNDIAVSIILISEQLKRKVKFKASWLNRKLDLL